MKCIVKGRLAERPKKQIRSVRGENKAVVNTAIYIYDPQGKELSNGMREGIPVPIVAWDDNAEIIASKDKGELITFAGQARGMKWKVNGADESITVLGFIVNRIDPVNDIASQMSRLVQDYNSHKIDTIYYIED